MGKLRRIRGRAAPDSRGQASRRMRHGPVWLLFLGGALLITIALSKRLEPAAPVFGYRVVRAYPHDPEAFTQGLLFDGGYLYESTGMHGRSSLRKVELESGCVVRQHNLENWHFGEGLALWQGQLVQLTWRSGVGFIYDQDSFEPLREFRYSVEGWGLTHDGTHFILSDGTATLYYLDSADLKVVRSIRVTDRGRLVANLNELECINGEIYANVWQTSRIARISPQSGRVTAWIDLTGLRPNPTDAQIPDVLNGIAYDVQGKRLFVTGKYWSTLFEIEIVKR